MFKKILIYGLLAAVGAFIVGPFAAKYIAPAYNRSELMRLERIAVQEMTLRGIQYHAIDSSLHHEQYLMISSVPRDTWRQSCIYYMRIDLEVDSPQDGNKVAALTAALTEQLGTQADIAIHRQVDFITISVRRSIPLGAYYMISGNDDNTSTLAPLVWLYPLRFYDPECRTVMLHNGA